MKKIGILVTAILFGVLTLISIVCLLPYYNKLLQSNTIQPKVFPEKRVKSVVKDDGNDKQSKESNVTVGRLYYPRLKFAISLLEALQKEEAKENILFSPHSVYRTLLLAYFGAAGETETAFKNTLGLDWFKSKADVENLYQLEKKGD